VPAGGQPPAHRASDAQRHVRARLVARDSLLRTRTQYIWLVRARLRQHGWQVPTGSAEYCSRRVLALPLPGRLRFEVAPLLAIMRQGHQQLVYADERIAALAHTDARERWLLVQAAGSMRRLHAARTAALRDWATRIAVRRGKGIAVVALVRRLAGILFALLGDGTVYAPRRRAPHTVPQPVGASPGSGCDERCDLSKARRLEGWVNANVAWATVAEPPHRWRPRPSTPLMRR
jgi:hypothetical protein